MRKTFLIKVFKFKLFIKVSQPFITLSNAPISVTVCCRNNQQQHLSFGWLVEKLEVFCCFITGLLRKTYSNTFNDLLFQNSWLLPTVKLIINCSNLVYLKLICRQVLTRTVANLINFVAVAHKSTLSILSLDHFKCSEMWVEIKTNE